MPFFRMLSFLVIFCVVTGAIGQVYQTPVQSYQATQPNMLPQPGQQPIRQLPLQTPPKTVIRNGVPVYQSNSGVRNQPAMSDRTMPTGYGSPYPTGQYPTGQSLPNNPNNVKLAAVQASGSVYGLPPQSPNPQPNIQNIQPVVPSIPANPAATTEPRRELVGHSEPPNRIIPFFLTPQEQQELDEFLMRWEKYSLGIKRYDVDFNMILFDETIPGSVPGKPYKTAFGYFKYISKPLRFVYHVEGEWVGGKKVERDEKKNSNIYAEKIIIDEKAVFKYEFDARKVWQVNVPPELVGKGIADSPLPLIFGAKANEMKKRFSMKIVTSEQYKSSQIWLQAKPFLSEDQQEFSQIEIRLDRETLRAIALKKEDINGKAFTVYTLLSPKINDRLTSFLEDIKKWFTPVIPEGWVLEVNDWVSEIQVAQQQPISTLPGATPSAIPATAQPPMANQQQPPPQRNEIPLYQPKF